MKHSFVLAAVMQTPWAILPAKLAAILAVVHRHAAGEKLDPEEVRAIAGAARRPEGQSQSGIAILPLFGTIVPRAGMFSDTSGATSAEGFTKQFRALLRDASVSTIVIDVDSPGGAVLGIDELSQEIYRARGEKPVIAVANHLAASAAYWIASAADELVVTPSGEVGSIGVFAAHEDLSAMLDHEGVKVNLISAGKFKVEGNPYEPLTPEARTAIQGRVDDYYDMFTKAVARNRGVKAADVRGGFGEGRVVGAKEALKLGMADRIATLDETVQRLARSKSSSPSAEADLDFRRRRARLAINQ